MTTAVLILLAFVLVERWCARGDPFPRRSCGRWARSGPGALAIVALAVVCFHVTYLAYRNIKSVAPLLRPGDVFDAQLLDLERTLFGGRDPGVLLHDLLGTGASAHALSDVYMLFFTFIPVVLAAGLVFLPDLRAGLHVATALSLTWLLGAGSYLILPSIGPVPLRPAAFAASRSRGPGAAGHAHLPARAVPAATRRRPGAAQSIGAFASLHTAICATALFAAHVLGHPAS